MAAWQRAQAASASRTGVGCMAPAGRLASRNMRANRKRPARQTSMRIAFDSVGIVGLPGNCGAGFTLEFAVGLHLGLRFGAFSLRPVNGGEQEMNGGLTRAFILRQEEVGKGVGVFAHADER